MNRKIVITGSPGVGKTTLIEALRARGYKCYDEPARKILNKKIEANGVGFDDPKIFVEAMLTDIQQNYEASKNSSNLEFFDRAYPDLNMYCSVFKVDKKILAGYENELVYNNGVFILPIWKEIFVNDSLRKMPFEDSYMRQDELTNAYNKLGYNLIEVPKVSVDERVEFVLSNITE